MTRTPTSRTDKLAEIHDTLTEGIESLVTGEAWQAMLALRARLHKYSFNNTILILHQMPTASMIAGYEAWARMGRQVRKGEKSIKVLAPCVYRVTDADNESEKRSVLRGFRVASVFDVSQTDGPDLPNTTPTLLDGEAPLGAWDCVAAHVEAQGFTVERGDCGGANGWTNYASRIVRVRDDVTDAQALKTLVHEAAHVAMHEADRECRGRIEVEAESVAYLVCSALGFSTDGYSFPYVAGWSDGSVETVRATADRVIKAADAILCAVAVESEAVAA